MINGEEKRGLGFLRTILGRGLKNPSTQADAEKKKTLKASAGGVPGQEGVAGGYGQLQM